MLALAGVAVRRLLRERSNIFFVFIFPLLLVLLFGLQFGAQQQPVVAVVTLGGPVDGAQALATVDDIAVLPLADEPALVAAVERGDADAGLVLTADEVRLVTRPGANVADTRVRVEAAVVEAAADQRVLDAVVATGLLDASAVARRLDEVPPPPTASVRAVTLGGDGLADEFAGLGQFDLGASSQLLLFVFITSLTGSASVVQARQWGVLDRVLAGPTAAGAVIAGLGLGQLAVALTQALVIVVGTMLLFGVRWGDPIAAGAVVLAFAAVSAAAGLLLGSVLRNEQQAGALGVPIALALAALGGTMLPLELFTGTMLTLSRFTPHAWANRAFAEIVRRDAGVVDVLPQLGVLVAFAVVLGVAAAVLLRRRIGVR